ncbi:MAG TPA: hypothetical protein VIL48_21195 [Acidimicrobiales bacterium]
MRRAARAGVAAAGRSKRIRPDAVLGAAVVVAAAGAALWAADRGTAAQVAVALAGGAVVLALVVARHHLAPRWRVATVAGAAAATAVLYGASADGWPGRTGTVLATFALAAVLLAGAATATWTAFRGFGRLVAVMVAATLAAVPDQAGLHRLGVVGLAVALLVIVARGFSKAVLRVTAAGVLLAALVALVWIGDRAPATGVAGGSAGARLRPEDRADLVRAVAAEAASLRDELPCDGDRERPPDERLCDALATLAARAQRAERAGSGDTASGGGAGDAEAGATALGLNARLADLREQVAVRLLRTGDEAPARVELAREQAERAREAADAPPQRDPDLRTLAARGVDTLVTDALDPFVADTTAARLGSHGWVVLAVLALLGYRRLEVVNNRRSGGPITIAPFATAPGDEGLGLALEATMRNRVAGIALREPPPVPGAESTAKPTAPGVAALDGRPVPPPGSARALLDRVRGLVLPVPGITVEPTYARVPRDPAGAAGAPAAGDRDGDDNAQGGEGAGDEVRALAGTAPAGAEPDRAGAATTAADRGPDGRAGGPAAASDVEHVVTVRLVTTQGRRTLRGRSFARPTPEAAAEAAADFVVCDALSHGRLTPSWARWRSDDGAALGPYHTVLADTGRTGPRLPLAEQIELLETARAASPGTGLVLVELGHRYDLDERPLDALRVHLTAKALHPRFAQPRYRLAMSLAMLASPVRFAEHWLAPGRDEHRRQIAELLVETGLLEQARRSRWWRMADPRCPADPEKAAAWLGQPDPSPGTQRDILKVFLLMARTEFRALERRLSYPGLLAGAARQSERHVWWGLLTDPERRRTTRLRYRSARWIAELRLSLLPTQPGTRKARELRSRVEAMARRNDVGSTALYNAACFTSVLVDRAPRKGRERADLEEQAVRHLRRAARGGRGPVPSSGWLTTDPDLVALQAVPAFNDLVRRLAHDEDRRETAGSG